MDSGGRCREKDECEHPLGIHQAGDFVPYSPKHGVAQFGDKMKPRLHGHGDESGQTGLQTGLVGWVEVAAAMRLHCLAAQRHVFG